MPRLVVIVVTFNSAAEIGACLDAVPTAAPTTGHEVVVVDNASAP
jgi:glycosyltransferase involved in cell wall biosynthesis